MNCQLLIDGNFHNTKNKNEFNATIMLKYLFCQFLSTHALLQVLECLFRQKWSSLDGLGALIISPTRELAYQTFEVLRKIGKFHDFSAGLVIGGKVADF